VAWRLTGQSQSRNSGFLRVDWSVFFTVRRGLMAEPSFRVEEGFGETAVLCVLCIAAGLIHENKTSFFLNSFPQISCTLGLAFALCARKPGE